MGGICQAQGAGGQGAVNFFCRMSPFSGDLRHCECLTGVRHDAGKRFHPEALTRALIIVWATGRQFPPIRGHGPLLRCCFRGHGPLLRCCFRGHGPLLRCCFRGHGPLLRCCFRGYRPFLLYCCRSGPCPRKQLGNWPKRWSRPSATRDLQSRTQAGGEPKPERNPPQGVLWRVPAVPAWLSWERAMSAKTALTGPWAGGSGIF